MELLRFCCVTPFILILFIYSTVFMYSINDRLNKMAMLIFDWTSSSIPQWKYTMHIKG